MPRTRKTAASKPQKIYGWPVTSTTEREGLFAKYFVWLYSDGHLSCDCPGWIFHRKKNDGHCKHTRAVKDEAVSLVERFRRGEELPKVVEQEFTFRIPETTFKQLNEGAIKVGRHLEV